MNLPQVYKVFRTSLFAVAKHYFTNGLLRFAKGVVSRRGIVEIPMVSFNFFGPMCANGSKCIKIP